MSVSTRTLPQGVEGSAGSYKINLRDILHMYTIGAVIMCSKPFFFCFIPKFPKDFKNFSQTVKFLNLDVLILETMKMAAVSRILILRPDLPQTRGFCEANLVSESKSKKQFRRVFRGGD